MWGMLGLLSVLWGGSFFFIGVIVIELPPLWIVLLRLALAAPVLWLIVLVLRLAIPTSVAVWRTFIGMGLLNNVIPFCLIVWGQTHIASGLAAILNATTPLFTVLIARYLLADERGGVLKVCGTILGFMGVILMLGLSSLQGLTTQVVAQLAILGAAISYALASVYGRRFKALHINAITVAAGQVTAAALILALITVCFEHPLNWRAISPQVWLATVGLAVFSTALAYILYFRILASAGATNLALVTFLVPVTAILLGTLWLDETLQVTHFVGMGLIGIGLAAIDGRLFKRVLGCSRADKRRG